MNCKNPMFLALSVLLLASCSSKKDAAVDTSQNVTSSLEGQFIDAPVEGLNFSSKSNNGVTGANGTFKCTLGEEVVFKLGTTLEIGKASCGSKIFLDNLDSRANKVKIGAILQSFGIVNGLIKIPDAVRTTAPPAINFQTASDNEIQGFVSGVNSTHSLNLTAVSMTNAESHINQSLVENIKLSATLVEALDNIAWYHTDDGGTDTVKYKESEDVHIEKNVDTQCELDFYLSLNKKMSGSNKLFNVYAYVSSPHLALNGAGGERVTGDIFSSKFNVTISNYNYNGNFSAYLDLTNKRLKGKMQYTVSGTNVETVECSATINEVIDLN